MKKLLLTVAALCVSVSLYAQGTVAFTNTGAGGKPLRYDSNGDGQGDRNLALADGVQVSLWWAPLGTTDPDAAVWEMLGARVDIIGTGGLFFGGTRTVPAAPTATYAFQVRAWETSIADWATASTRVGSYVSLNANGQPGGIIFESATGGGPAPAPLPVNLSAVIPSITVGQVVPEPSTLALGLLGVGALLLIRRRK